MPDTISAVMVVSFLLSGAVLPFLTYPFLTSSAVTSTVSLERMWAL